MSCAHKKISLSTKLCGIPIEKTELFLFTIQIVSIEFSQIMAITMTTPYHGYQNILHIAEVMMLMKN